MRETPQIQYPAGRALGVIVYMDGATPRSTALPG